MKLLGVILAGGRATRMGGGDKALLPLGGKPLIAHVIERLRPQLPDLIINANGDPARFAEFELPVVADRITGYQGPLAGIHAAMLEAKEKGASHIVSVAADTPFFPIDLVQRLIETQTRADAEIVVAESSGGIHPVFGLWPVALEGDLAAFLASGENPKVAVWANRHRVAEALFEADGFDPFFNINTREDLARAEKLLAELRHD
jgi:molybdenum cofactor guanylyltransferase